MSELINLVGLGAGVVLYAMLLAMVVRAGRARGAQASLDLLLLATAILGLVWNLCALPVYELPRFGVIRQFPVLIAVGFSALGFLPAVVVHSVLRGEWKAVRGRIRSIIVILAYAVSSCAAVLQFSSVLIQGTVPSAIGLRLLTYSFVALVVPLAVVTRGQPGARRTLWAAALAIFAVSALHLSGFHQGDASWPVEIIGHHASVPLALAILYQDYPFALADIFLKRALALLTLIALIFIVLAIGMRSADPTVRPEPGQIALLVTLWLTTALLYPPLRRATAWFVDTIVLQRPNYPSLRTSVARRVQSHEAVGALLDDVCQTLEPALSARHVTWRELSRPVSDDQETTPSVAVGPRATALLRSLAMTDEEYNDLASGSVSAIVAVAVSEPPQYLIVIADVTGGRRFLSDDVAALEAIAVVAARRIDAIRMTNERHDRELREREIAKLATEAELRALRAQINPHFLFNALTTIGYLIQTAPDRALDTLMRLTSLLRAVLRSEGEFTTLGRELEVIEAYLDIERTRFEDRLRVSIDVPGELRDIKLPPLVLQPVVENAVKHGIAPRHAGGEVTVRARLEPVASGARQLLVIIHDSGLGTTAAWLARSRETGVGLRNVESRLASYYGSAASLSIQTAPGQGTTVEIRLPATFRSAAEEAALRRGTA
jgi:two-component system LytT family sensor kinase